MRSSHWVAAAALWIVFTILIIVLGYIMLKACGLRVFGRDIAWCERTDLAGQARISGLTLELSALDQQYRQLPLCGPSGPGMGRAPLPMPGGGGLTGRSGPDAIADPAPGAGSQTRLPPATLPPEAAAPGASSMAPGVPGPAPGGQPNGTEGAGEVPPSGDTPPREGGNSERAQGADPSAARSPQSGQGNDMQGDDNTSGEEAAETACAPGKRRVGEPVILALDHSRSMALPTDMDDQVATELEALIDAGGPAAISAREINNGYVTQPGTKRLDVLKSGVGQWVDALPSGVDVGLVTFAGCDGVVDSGIFHSAIRGDLKSRVQALQPKPATPVAEALKTALGRAGGMRGKRIVLITDGRDTCSGDPCRIARASRGVRVDVIAMGGGQALSCIAEATGGQLIESTASRTTGDLLTQIMTNAGTTCR